MKHSMAQRHNIRITTGREREPGFGRMLMLSVLIHIFLVIFVSGVMFNRSFVPERQSYKVSLMNRPVEQPQRGHSAATPKKKTEIPVVAQSTPEPAPAPKLKTTTAPKPAPKLETAPKPESKPVATQKVEVPAPAPAKIKTPEKKVISTSKPKTQSPPKVDVQPLQPMLSSAEIERIYQQDTLASIEEIKRNKDPSTRIEQLKQQLAAQATEPVPATVTVSTEKVGSVAGTGVQAGIAFEEWIKEYLMRHWNLPSAYWNKKLRSTAELRFDAQGNRTGYDISASGDSLFDRSVEKSVLSLETLPTPPGKSFSRRILFDPNEMLQK